MKRQRPAAAPVPAAAPEDSLQALRRLLDAGVEQHAERSAALGDGQLVALGHDQPVAPGNDQPMALTALQALGGNAAQLQALADRHGALLPPAPPPEAWPAGDAWAGRFGDIRAWPAYRSLFRQWLLHEGAADMLPQVLPQLMPGCSGAAFGGLVRTAQGLRAGHAGEIADGLAYWASRWQGLGPVPVPAPARQAAPDLLTALRAARRALGAQAVPTQTLIAERMASVAAWPGFAAACARVPLGPDLPAAVAALAAHLVVRHPDFTAGHLVIAARAVVRLRPFFDEADALFGAFAQAALAAVLSTGAPLPADLGRHEADLPAPPPWAQLLRRARLSSDAHVLQLVDACREHEAALGGTVWRRAAARALGLA